MSNLDTLVRNVEALQASVDKRLGGLEDRFGRMVIPAASRTTFNGKGDQGKEFSRFERAGLEMGSAPSSVFPQFGEPAADRSGAKEYAAIASFVRKGDESGLAAMAAINGGDEFYAGSGMSVGSDPDGGWTVLPVVASEIRKRTFHLSPLARLARKVTIAVGDAFEEPIDVGDIGAAWVGEKDARPELETTSLAVMRVPVNEIYTNQPVTQRLLDDSAFDIGGWLEDKISDKFARAEGAAFINGDGIEKPKGLLFDATSPLPDGQRPYFQMQHINTGVGDGFKAGASGVDALIDTVYSLRPPYRANARWLMNTKTAATIRKFKDTDGNFVFSDAKDGIPASLLGFPVEFDEEMPNVGGSARPIAFGDFNQGYIVVDKPGIRLLRDPYTRKPHVLFYAYRRVGGQVQNGEAIKFVRLAVSD